MRCLTCVCTPLTYPRPLDCLLSAHEAQQALCGTLADFCASPDLWDDVERARTLYGYFAAQLPMHVADEEEDLIPCLRRRGLIDEPGIECAGMLADHERIRELSRRFMDGLSQLAQGIEIDDPTRLIVQGVAFAHTYRRHVEMEEKLIFPLARQLPRDDTEALRRAMAARRH